jgi:hypothetical protein
MGALRSEEADAGSAVDDAVREVGGTLGPPSSVPC